MSLLQKKGACSTREGFTQLKNVKDPKNVMFTKKIACGSREDLTMHNTYTKNQDTLLLKTECACGSLEGFTRLRFANRFGCFYMNWLTFQPIVVVIGHAITEAQFSRLGG